MMECKKALVQADGDAEKAVEILREQFKKIQDKRADNATEEGRIFFATKDDGSEAAFVEIQVESAPVATGEALEEILRDVAMHIAAMNPSCCFATDLDQADVDAEKARLTEQASASGKPAEIVEKIVGGQMGRFFMEKGVLLHQAFAKDDKMSVEKALSAAGLEAVGFERWQVGVA
ncbi:UNVERIFIED_CONTAM: hypothetical protein GTU68_006648 [Idotea baltica]|nr:hypothetical protein [Idotea baltica]